MTKAKISEYDAVASNNTDVNGVNIAEGCPPSGMNNMGREIMAALKRFQVGSDGDGVTVGGNLVVSGSSTLSTTSISSADINAGTIDGTAIGGSTPAAGSFTTLNTSGAVVFNDAGADVDFRVEGDTEANLLFVDASTDRVGIGTNTPAVSLDIDIGTDNNAIYCRSSDQFCNIALTDDVGSVKLGSDNGSLFFETGGTTSFTSIIERMRIDSSGNVGIGTSTPNIYSFSNTTNTLGIQASGTNQNGLVTVAGTGTGSSGFSLGNATIRRCGIYALDGSALGFYTNATNSGTAVTERMRITSGGEVYIAGTTDRGAYNLQCNGTGVWGQGAYVNGSDERMKQNITDLQDGLSVVTQLRPVTYQYREEFSRDQNTQPGFIAQELQAVLDGKDYKDGVVPEGPEYLNVAYQNLIPILTKAIQELKAELDAVKAELATLKG